jgi:hypothetical protein
MVFTLVVAAPAQGNKKPTAVSSRGFLLKFRSTSANGVANYYSDDQCDNLCDVFQHCGCSLCESPARSSAESESASRSRGRGLWLLFLLLLDFFFLTAIAFGHINPWLMFTTSYADFRPLDNSRHSFISTATASNLTVNRREIYSEKDFETI